MIPDNIPTRLFRWLLPVACSIVLVMMTPHGFAEETLSAKPASLPPPVELEYVTRVKYTAMSIGGSSTIRWQQTGSEYDIRTVARGNLLGTVLETSSKGRAGEGGLMPSLFTEQRHNKNQTRVTFNYENHTALFSDNGESVSFSNGLQDQTSIVWQLAAMGRKNPEKFQPGSTFTFMVAGRRRISQWDLHVMDEETIGTALGEIRAVYLAREDSKGKKTEVWLAPDHNWYPVKLIFTDNKGLRLEQVVRKIRPL